MKKMKILSLICHSDKSVCSNKYLYFYVKRWSIKYHYRCLLSNIRNRSFSKLFPNSSTSYEQVRHYKLKKKDFLESVGYKKIYKFLKLKILKLNRVVENFKKDFICIFKKVFYQTNNIIFEQYKTPRKFAVFKRLLI